MHVAHCLDDQDTERAHVVQDSPGGPGSEFHPDPRFLDDTRPLHMLG